MEARQVLGRAYLGRVDRELRKDAWSSEAPEEGWKLVVGLAGIPVENERRSLRNHPWVTWSTGAAMVVVSLMAFALGPPAAHEWAWLPTQTLRRGGLTLVTGFLLHAGWLHLLGNLYFLLAFGDDVEDRLGRGRYLGLLFLALICGDVMHVLVEPDLTVPLVGASGGISGVLGCYAVLYPRAKLSQRFLVTWISLPAYAYFLLWIAGQVFLARMQSMDLTHVSAAAHLGGAMIGVWIGFATRNRAQTAVPQVEGR